MTTKKSRIESLIDINEGVARLRNANTYQKIYSFYSSVLQGITTEPALMTVPIDDHMVHRGHAVFDTCSVKNGFAYGLSFHLDRFLDSARKCRIKPYADKESLRSIILETLAVSNKRDDIYCRFWMSVGRGDFAVAPDNCSGTNFYCAVHEYHSSSAPNGISEITISIPLKTQMLATTKTNNYLINALSAMEAKEKGGSLGLQCDEAGNIAECSIGSVGFVFKDGTLKTPKLDKILKSTTLFRAFELWRDSDIPIKDFIFDDIPLKAVSDAVEMIGFGGGKVTAIVKLDDIVIGNGKPGPVFEKINELLIKDASKGSEFVDEIPYDV